MQDNFIKSQDNIYHIAELIRGLFGMREFNLHDQGMDPYVHSGDYYAIVTCNREKNYFIQFVTAESQTELRIETSSIHEKADKLTKEKIKWLLDRGWKMPTKDIVNYSKIVKIISDMDLYMTAADIVTTFIMIFDFNPADSLEVEIDEAQILPNS